MITYTAQGLDGAGNDFEIIGTVEGKHPLDLEALKYIGQDVFRQLTQGRATYGHPGVDGCHGPYDIRVLTLEKTP